MVRNPEREPPRPLWCRSPPDVVEIRRRRLPEEEPLPLLRVVRVVRAPRETEEAVRESGGGGGAKEEVVEASKALPKEEDDDEPLVVGAEELRRRAVVPFGRRRLK